MLLDMADATGRSRAVTPDRPGDALREDRWRSMRTVLDTGGPWVLVEPCGAIRAAGVRLDRVDRIRDGTLVDLVVERERSTVLRAVGVTAGGEGPIRLPLRDALTLDENITIAEMVFTKLPIDVAHGGSVIVQLVEATPSNWQTAPHDDSSRAAELESALRRIHDLILQFKSQSGDAEDLLPTIAEPLPDLLSVRRRQVAIAVLGGKAVTDIAAEFDLSPHTIRNHLKAVYRELGVSSHAELQRRFHP